MYCLITMIRCQGELSILRNKLTVYESQNQLLEQEKSDLAETVNMLRAGQIKTEPGRKYECFEKLTA